jgi:rubrerythrin
MHDTSQAGPDATLPRVDDATEAPERSANCDLSTVCLVCGSAMRPEHAHYRCPACGWRDSCCDGR